MALLFGPPRQLKEIDWKNVKRVLVVRLRSIGDTVLTTPSLIALKRFVPDAEIDILLEDWVAPLLDGFDAVDNVISIPTKDMRFLPTPHTDILLEGWVARLLNRFSDADNIISIPTKDTPDGKLSRTGLFFTRSAIAWLLRERKYDVAFNLHGGTTATFFTAASRATHRVGLASYQYSFLYNHLLSSPADFWQSELIHSAEQQLALLGFVGVPVEDRPKSGLAVTEEAAEKVRTCVSGWPDDESFALLHPTAAFATKQWSTENFARTAEFLAEIDVRTIAIALKTESKVLDDLKRLSKVPIRTFDDLTLPEITALASRAKLFVGNDSGIAHMAAAVQTPTVVIFGSSNRTHWRPWTDAPNEIVYEDFPCQPCAGYECAVFGEPRCILSVESDRVIGAIERILRVTKGRHEARPLPIVKS